MSGGGYTPLAAAVVFRGGVNPPRGGGGCWCGAADESVFKVLRIRFKVLTYPFCRLTYPFYSVTYPFLRFLYPFYSVTYPFCGLTYPFLMSRIRS